MELSFREGHTGPERNHPLAGKKARVTEEIPARWSVGSCRYTVQVIGSALGPCECVLALGLLLAATARQAHVQSPQQRALGWLWRPPRRQVSWVSVCSTWPQGQGVFEWGVLGTPTLALHLTPALALALSRA